MVRLVVCFALLVVGVIGKEILVSEDKFIDNELSDVKEDIPYDIPDGKDTEFIPTSGNSYSIKHVHDRFTTHNFSMNRMYDCCKWRITRASTPFDTAELSELL